MKLSIRMKLIITCLTMALMMTIGGGLATYYINSLTTEINHLSDNTTPKIIQSARLHEQSYILIDSVKDYLILGSGNVQEIKGNIVKAEEQFTEYQKISDADERELLQAYKKQFELLILEIDRIPSKPITEESPQTIKSLMNVLNNFESTVNGQLEHILLAMHEETKEARDRGNDIFSLAMIFVGLGTVFAATSSMTWGYFIAKAISGPVKELERVAGNISEGDLSITEVNVKNQDELGHLAQSFGKMSKKLQEIIMQMQDKANTLSYAAQQISATNQQMSAGSQNQAHQVHVISDSIAKLSKTVDTVNHAAQKASAASEQTNIKAHEGREVVSNSIAMMENISNLIYELGNNSNQIGEIIELIEEIADQTNLLALNAAIEAARAGEHGKGFAVVAEQVRQLAEKAGKSTKEINQLITQIQKGISMTVSAVEEGKQQINQTGEAFELIENVIGNTANQINEIGIAVQDQVNLSQEVVGAIESIAAITEETAAGNEEAAASAQELAGLAEEMQKVTAQFKIQGSR